MDELLIRPVTANDWPLVERLFGQRGACGGCWCMHWHAPSSAKAWENMKGEGNRASLEAMIEDGECHAVIALADSEPVGWCRFGPANTFQKLERSRKLWREGMADWSVVCFFVAASHRGHGVASALLSEAAQTAFRHGARSIEGYPSVPKSGVIPAAFAWTGVPKVFEAAGFTAVAYDAGARRIYKCERPTA